MFGGAIDRSARMGVEAVHRGHIDDRAAALLLHLLDLVLHAVPHTDQIDRDTGVYRLDRNVGQFHQWKFGGCIVDREVDAAKRAAHAAIIVATSSGFAMSAE